MDEQKEGEKKKKEEEAKGQVDKDERVQLSKAFTGRCCRDLSRMR